MLSAICPRRRWPTPAWSRANGELYAPRRVDDTDAARLISDQSAWRRAFFRFFGVQSAPGGPLALGRRLEPSDWRREYRLRTRLIQYARTSLCKA